MRNINYGRITENESNYLKGFGFWSNNKAESINNNITDREKTRQKEEQYEVNLKVFKYAIVSRKLNKILHDWYDISVLFGEEYYFKKFINYLFDRSTTVQHKGVLPIVYVKGFYVFDYKYLLSVIEKWGVDELGFDKDNFALFMRKFHFDVGENNFNFRGNFLINILFGFHGDIVAKFKYDKYFYNHMIVKDEQTGEEFYYYGVPILSTSILKYVDRDIVEFLFDKRENFRLKQILFGKEVLDYKSSIKIFFAH